ncbi:T9SS type A sorting domain-containing protein [Flavobacterium sp. Sd200]|uniref:M43 family zinc metalloprotease n=1 Tax=Flavobacterium sp. Sd200 TaxID=2692211 RepID=UPI0013699512|nr:M43 family zinc metalloprotease [Flavobacterium sp. Sd200]MXN91398.1 T9SS type A sorting domain-containing protein [Flavobacterium sp. Sd200]
MKKLVSIFVFLFSVAAFAQHLHCGTDDLHRTRLATDRDYAQRVHDFDTYSLQQRMQSGSEIYRIPVVVHIMHKGEALGTGTNLSDDAVRAAIKNLNERFRKVPGTPGDGSGVDTGIEFVLAVRTPDDKCTNGINRIDMTGYLSYMESGVFYNNAGLAAYRLKDISKWDQNNYYNIWIVSEFDGGDASISGYASYPGSTSDGAVIKASEFIDPLAKTNVHQMAHALYLYHTYEGDSDGETCPLPDGCGSGLGDCCADTPPHKRTLGDCFGVTPPNTCDNSSTDDSFVKNYMGFNSGECANSFTQNQKDRMRMAIAFFRSSFLPINGNLSLVSPLAPVADFEIASGAVVCAAGELVSLIDKTSCIPNTFLADSSCPDVSFAWRITNGTDVYDFTSQNPVCTISTPGIYSVRLTVTSRFGVTSVTKRDAFVVAEPVVAACTPRSDYIIYGMIENVTLNTINRSTNRTGPYTNFSCTDNTLLYAGGTYNLSVTMNANHGTFNGSYEAYIDYNNNGIFENAELVMSGTSVHSEAVVHTQDIIIPADAVQNTMLAMRVAGAINQITDANRSCTTPYYFGDIEDYGVYISSTLSAEELLAKNQIILSPNPATNSFVLNSDVEIETVTLYNIMGQKVCYKQLNSAQSVIDVSQLSAGAYMVHATASGKTSVLKLIKN